MNIQMKVRSLEKVRLFIKRGQIRSLTILLVYALRLQSNLPHFLKLADNIIFLWKTMGRKAMVNYLKECVRATVQFVAGQQYIRNNIPIKLNRAGLPKIIPGPLRVQIASIKLGSPLSEPITILRCVLSILQIYRAVRIPGLVPDMGTITGPYTGTVTSLIKEVRAVTRWFPELKVRLGGSWKISETSGPNSPLSTWGAVADVFALVWDPKVFVHIVRYARKRRATKHLVWLIALYVVVELVYFSMTTFMLMSLLIPGLGFLLGLLYVYNLYKVVHGIKWCTGRLATFEEGGGKVRIVAIFDAWSQWLLKPLHDGIYDLFAQMPTDGTHNQTKPLHSLMEYIRISGAKVYSLDITAATDRIPVWLQTEVLHCFKFNAAEEWKALISDRSFRVTNGFKDSVNKSIVAQVKGTESARYCQEVTYAVGQPMGAYSSWAVMALTHHVIVQIAAYRVGHEAFFRHYALLGDDLVIADKAVAEAYLALMKELGVGINRLKSIESDIGVAEFAKRWVHPHFGEFSPIGAKLLLAVVRNVTMTPALFAELAQKGVTLYPSSISAVLLGLQKIRGKRKLSPDLIRDLEVAALAPNGILDHAHMITEWLNIWIAKIARSSLEEFITRNLLIVDYWKEQIHEVEERPHVNFDYFFRCFWRTPMINGRITAWLLQPLVIISPGFWLYASAIVHAVINPEHSFSLQMWGIMHPDQIRKPGALSLSMDPEKGFGRSIDWRERGAVAKQTIALKKYGEALRRVTIPEQPKPILLIGDGMDSKVD